MTGKLLKAIYVIKNAMYCSSVVQLSNEYGTLILLLAFTAVTVRPDLSG
jgi:hypothetical protein